MKVDFTLFKKRNKDIESASDEQLMRDLSKGSTLAFTQLVKRYKHRVYIFISVQVDKPEDAEDICQEVFIAIFKNPTNYQYNARVTSYIFAVANNLVRNHYRSKRRRIASVNTPDEDMTADEGSCLVQQHIRKSNTSLINNALRKLSVDERQILYLCEKENFSYNDIAIILQVKKGTVRSRLNTARSKLLAQLEKGIVKSETM